jgi:hypothetical protein
MLDGDAISIPDELLSFKARLRSRLFEVGAKKSGRD